MKYVVAVLLCALMAIAAAKVTCPPQTGPNAIHIPDPEDCTAFYVCEENGIPAHNHCPDGLVFNSKLSVCDWPVNVPGCNV